MFIKKKIAIDVVLNVVAAAMPIALLQLLLFPSLAAEIGADLYGFIVAIYSVFALAPGSFGNVLNNLRLVHQTDWGASTKSDFNILLLIAGCLSVAITIAYAVLNGLSDYLSLFLISCTAVCWVAREFGSVAFRLDLNFKAICVNSFIMCIGYALGYLLFLFLGNWAFIFLIGQFFSCAYIFIKSDIFSLKFQATVHFKQTAKEATQLTGSVFMARASTYCDRLILYPLLGGGSVAVYYAATVISKLVNMVTASLNSVILSYLSRQAKSEHKQVLLTLLFGFVVCLFFYVVILFAAPYVLQILYPQFMNESILLVPITAATSLVAVLSNLLNPYLLKFRAIHWQLLTSSLSLIFYIFLVLALFFSFGLLGFCVGALITEIIKFCIQLLIYFRSNPSS